MKKLSLAIIIATVSISLVGCGNSGVVGNSNNTSVATVNELPTEGMQVGDVYDIQETNMNVAWNGESWDDLGGVFDFDLTAYVKREELSAVALSGSYNDLDDKPKIPTATSQLVNDSNFKSIEASTVDLEAGVSELPNGHIYLVYE